MHCLQDSEQPRLIVHQVVVTLLLLQPRLPQKLTTMQSLVNSLCESVDETNIRSYKSKTESTECKTFLGLAMFYLKIPPLEHTSQPSALTQVHPVLVSKADLFSEV